MSVEVCGSAYKPLPPNPEKTAETVKAELVEMGLLEVGRGDFDEKLRYVPWGQVIFDHNRKAAFQTGQIILIASRTASAGTPSGNMR